MAKIVNVHKLVEFSHKEGVLNTMEDRRRVKKDVLRTKSFNIVLICLDIGQEIPLRPEPYDVCFYVIEGQGTFTVGNKQTELNAGSIIFAPANIAREIKSTKRLSILGIQEAH